MVTIHNANIFIGAQHPKLLNAAILEIFATAKESADEADDACAGYTKYDIEGQELPADAKEWHYHWQHDTGMEWLNCNLEDKRLTLTEAKKALAKLGNGWGLPPAEKPTDGLLAEIDRSKYAPALRNPNLFPNIKHEAYWCSTPDASDPQNHAWVVGLGGGGVDLYGRNNTAWVRPCRARRAASQ